MDRSHYRKVTSYSHSALHTGRFLGGVAGQLILSGHFLHLDKLNYVTLAGVSLSLLVSLFLPTVKRSIYFDARFSVISNFSGFTSNDGRRVSSVATISTLSSGERKMGMSMPKPKQVGAKKRIVRASRALVRDFKIAYSNRYVLKWSLWWSIAQAIYLQVGIYAEPLWKEVIITFFIKFT